MMDTFRPNRLVRAVGKLDKLPSLVRPWVRNRVLRRAVPLTGTTRLQYVELTPQRVEVAVANTRRVQNHIGGVHAAAMTLLAETATGMVVGMNVRDDCVPVVKQLMVAFKKRTQGAMRAVATLTYAQRALMQAQDKGEITVAVHVSDESGAQPVECEFIWAWIPSGPRQKLKESP
jgi:acyl-coenzyme A thioesterase PaaI-like protein